MRKRAQKRARKNNFYKTAAPRVARSGGFLLGDELKNIDENGEA